jgi:hypothetical protein
MKRALLAALAAAVVTSLIAVVPAALSTHRPPSCLRDGARLVAAEGNVRVVRVKTRRPARATRSESLLACWAPTGRRGTVVRELDFGDDLRTRSVIEIVDGRYVGAIVDYEGGVTETIRAHVYDARNRRKVHDSRPCDFERGDFTGTDDVAFLPRGGMAFACSRLVMFKDASSTTLQTLEPAGTDVRNLAVGRFSRGFSPRLYWSVFTGDQATAKSLPITG